MTEQQLKETIQQASSSFKVTESDVNELFDIKKKAFENGIEFALSHPETAKVILLSLREYKLLRR